MKDFYRVIHRLAHDTRFRQELTQNMDTALDGYGLVLSASERDTIRRMLTCKYHLHVPLSALQTFESPVPLDTDWTTPPITLAY